MIGVNFFLALEVARQNPPSHLIVFRNMAKRHPSKNRCRALASLELLFVLLLILAFLALVLQLFPDTAHIALWGLNPRNWPRTMWFVVNIAVVLILLTVRFGPQFVEDFRERKARLASEDEKHQKQQELKEQRDSLDRLKQAQRRRIY